MQVPQRIVSLLAGGTEMLACLGLLDEIKGISHECDYPPAIAGKPVVTRSTLPASLSSTQIDAAVRQQLEEGESLYQLDVEEICRIDPDLVITQAQCDVCAVRYQDVMELVESRLSLASTTVLALNPTSLEEVMQDILRVGRTAGRLDRAEQLVKELQQRLLVVEQQVRGKPRPRVACIEWIEPIMLAGNWVPDLVSTAGAESLLAEVGVESAYFNWQNIVELDPEVIVIAPCGFNLQRSLEEAAGMPGWDHWNELSAVRNKRVFVLDGNALLNRPGPRVVDTIELLARLFHPDDSAAPGDEGSRQTLWDQLGSRV